MISATEINTPVIIFDELYRSYGKLVRKTVSGFRFPEGVAEDLVQDIFIKAWQNIQQLKTKDAMGGWLRSVARNVCIDEKNKEKKREILTKTGTLDEFINEALVASDAMSSSLNEKLESQFRFLIDMHSNLERREVARLFYLEEKSVKEISLAIGLNINTVLSHLRRFRIIVAETLLQWAEEQSIELTPFQAEFVL